MSGQHEKGTPLRFPIGTRVSVRISPASVRGTSTDLISIHTCAGGQWASATVVEHEYHQPGWCPTYFTAYIVSVDGDTAPDGSVFGSVVREDDERCIRRLLEENSAPTPAAFVSGAANAGLPSNSTTQQQARVDVGLGDDAEKVVSALSNEQPTTLADALSHPDLSDSILRHLSFRNIQTLRSVSRRANIAVTAHLDRYPSMVIVGGLHIDLDTDDEPLECDISNSVRAFRPGTMQWYTLPPLNVARFCAAACSLPDGRIFVAGGVIGFDDDNAMANQGVFVEEGRSMRGQPEYERGGYGSWKGRNASRGTLAETVEMFDPQQARWSVLDQKLPRGSITGERTRAGARACLDESGSNILLIGGTVEEVTHPFSREVDVFDLETNRWVQREVAAFPPMNQARSEFVLARVPGKGIFVAGGTNRYR